MSTSWIEVGSYNTIGMTCIYGLLSTETVFKKIYYKIKSRIKELKLNTFIILKFNNIIKLIIVLLDER